MYDGHTHLIPMGDSEEEIVQLPEVTPSFSGGLPFGSYQQLDCENRSIIQYTSSPRIGTWLHLGFKHAYSLFLSTYMTRLQF